MASETDSASSARSAESGLAWVSSGSGSQGPTYASRRARAERSRFSEVLVMTRAR